MNNFDLSKFLYVGTSPLSQISSSSLHPSNALFPSIPDAREVPIALSIERKADISLNFVDSLSVFGSMRDNHYESDEKVKRGDSNDSLIQVIDLSCDDEDREEKSRPTNSISVEKATSSQSGVNSDRDLDETIDQTDTIHGNVNPKSKSSKSKVAGKMSKQGVSEPSSSTGFLREKYCSPNGMEIPLRLLIVGHNPSEKSWIKGHYYANPSNRMWPILRECGIVPASYTCESDDICPSELGIGFTDLGTGYCETDSSNINDRIVRGWTKSLYSRIEDHMERCRSNLSPQPDIPVHPRIIAFAGVRQWKAQFANNFFTSKKKSSADDGILSSEDMPTSSPPPKRRKKEPQNEAHVFAYGIQTVRPTNWPISLKDVEVYVMPSTSGAAAMSNEARIGPYRALATRLRQIPWPLK